MKNLIRLEELGMFLLAIMMFIGTGFSWWLFPALLLLPDISMVGYAVNNRIGAILYNTVHHKGVAVAVYGVGLLMEARYVELAGAILFGHAAMDRIFGYGLKFIDSFHHTHLDRIDNK